MLLRALSKNREPAIGKASSNPFAVALAQRYFRRYEFAVRMSKSCKRELLFKHMPAFDDVLITADLMLAKFSFKLGKRRNAMAPRSKVYRIGPYAPYGFVKLTRTADGFIEEYVRAQNGPGRRIWNNLIVPLMSIASNIVLNNDENDIRRDCYRFEIDGFLCVMTYGHFERIFTRSRKPVKTLGELVAFRSS